MPRATRSVFALAVMCLAACGATPASTSRSEKNSASPRGGGKFGGSGGDPSATAPGSSLASHVACDDEGGDSAEDFARALGICDRAAKNGFGLVSASFTRGYERDDVPNGQQHNTLPRFGDKLVPREGKRLGVLSTGFAQEFNGAPGRPFSKSQAWTLGDGGALPPGFPKAAAGCAQSTDVNDVIDLHLELVAPKSATGIKFDFDFHSSEWPDFICSTFNDGFIAFLSAKGFNGGVPDNISFDAKGNPVSVNNGFFDRCTPDITTGCMGLVRSESVCAGGPDELAGTGFGLPTEPDPLLEMDAPGCGGGVRTQGGATGWLSSQAPVEPGETFTLDFLIWDTGDGNLDSTVLVDNFQWIGGDVETTTERTGDPR